ncbi:MAG: hypothetical protein MI725_17645 [Pirellulales bacterium]|nr:hypothetical protein [Pirellulales bacterium]
MAQRIHVSTRKGLFTFEHGTGGWDIVDVAFLGVPVTMSLADARDGSWYAALDHGHFGVHLHRSRDEGKHWEEITAPQYPEGATVPQRMAEETTDRRPTKLAALSEIWALETGGADQPGLLWCGTIPGGLFSSKDGGDSWQLNEALWNREERNQWFGGGKDDPGLHSICVDPRDPRHLTVGISCGGVWQTRDAGASWECTSTGLRAEYMPPEQAYEPAIQDPHRLVACPGNPDHLWIQHHNGIFRSTDGGMNWQEIDNVVPSAFGFAVAVHPEKPATAWFIPAVKDELRVPAEGRVIVTKTEDGGESFTQQTQGLPSQHAYDIVLRHALDIDASGEVLAFGSTTGNFWITSNGGASWQTISTHLPPVYAVRFV